MVQDQHRAPLLEALRRYAAKVKAPLHVPGHKQGRAADSDWKRFIGDAVLSIDLTEAPGLDDLHAPDGPIKEAQGLAATAFGAVQSFFLVGGTTAGLHALILAACHPGSLLAVPRHAHRSIVGAMILSGTKPVWIPVQFHEELDVALAPDFRRADPSWQQAGAAVLVHPTYYGLSGAWAPQVAQIHAAGMPVLVDEAHGTHFAFHPLLPPSALSLGADGVVQSTHKTGGSLTQSSICHLGHSAHLDESRLREMLRLVQSTSPSYILMASLDAARRHLAIHGRTLWESALDLAISTRKRLSSLRGIRVHPSDDPTKLLIDVRGRGLTGFQASEHLWNQGVAVESSGLGYVLAVVTPGDTPATMDYLVQALNTLPIGPGFPPPPPPPPWPEVVVSPRDAYLGRKRRVSLKDSVGCIASEMVVPYPPGIPVVAPGERLTAEVVIYLQHAATVGYHLQGPTDPDLSTIQIMEE